MKLYRFIKNEYALDVVKNERLFLNTPDVFNDPFDCILESNSQDLKAAGDLILNYLNFEDLFLFAYNHANLISKRKEEAQKIIAYGKTLKTQLEISPFYKKWGYIDQIINQFGLPSVKLDIERRKRKYISLIKDVLEDSRQKTLLYCFSKRKEPILMWSHYANAHKGACIEFDIDEKEKDLVEVVYSDKKEKFDIQLVASLILGLTFLNKPFDPNDQELNKKVLKPCYTKSDEWSYEQEVRYLLTKESDRVFRDKGNYYIKSPRIISVTFGCRVDKNSQDYKDIIEIAKAKGIEIKYTTPNEDYFKLDETK